MDTRTILIIEDEPAAAKRRHPGEYERCLFQHWPDSSSLNEGKV